MAGRPPGKLSKNTEYVKSIMERMECCPFEGMAKIAMGQVDCLECDGEGEQGYTMLEDKIIPDVNSGQKLTCMRCHGKGVEPVPYEVRGRQFAELANYLAPKKKSIESKNTEVTQVVIRDYTGAGQEITGQTSMQTIEHEETEEQAIPLVSFDKDTDNA